MPDWEERTFLMEQKFTGANKGGENAAAFFSIQVCLKPTHQKYLCQSLVSYCPVGMLKSG